MDQPAPRVVAQDAPMATTTQAFKQRCGFMEGMSFEDACNGARKRQAATEPVNFARRISVSCSWPTVSPRPCPVTSHLGNSQVIGNQGRHPFVVQAGQKSSREVTGRNARTKSGGFSPL